MVNRANVGPLNLTRNLGCQIASHHYTPVFSRKPERSGARKQTQKSAVVRFVLCLREHLRKGLLYNLSKIHYHWSCKTVQKLVFVVVGLSSFENVPAKRTADKMNQNSKELV